MRKEPGCCIQQELGRLAPGVRDVPGRLGMSLLMFRGPSRVDLEVGFRIIYDNISSHM